MSARQTFLDELKAGLRKYPSGTVDDYIDYYDELISDRIANGEKETAVLQHIGTAKEVAASFKKENAINRAVSKPTLSNGVKALLAVLSVLSLPLLIPAAAVLLALIAAATAVFLSAIVALVFGTLFALVSVANMAYLVFTGNASVLLLILVTGLATIGIFIAFELMRVLLFLGRWVTRFLIQKLNIRHGKRRHNQSVNSEDL
jgi:uncharacterized membrane protein